MSQLVRIRVTPATERLGLADKIGSVWGWTTPTASGEEVIGDLRTDYAVNVFFEDAGQELWFAEQLLERLDHHPNLEITVSGKRMFYTSTGQWQLVDPKTPAR